MILRDYQKKAVDAAIRSLNSSLSNPCIVAPTGAGKSVIIAFLIKELMQNYNAGKILILAHVKELVVQNAEKLYKVDNQLNIGIYCAGLNRKDKNKNIIFSTVISAWNDVKNGINKSDIGHLDLIIIDEAHRISPKKSTVYNKLINLYKNECNTKILGLTATPFRTRTGSIIDDENILNTICYDIKIPFLINKNYISKPITIGALNSANMEAVAIKNGDFDVNESSAQMQKILDGAITEIIKKTKDRKHFICFCCNIEHAKATTLKLNSVGITSLVIHSKLKSGRDEIIKKFKEGEIKCLVNVNILTEGFDVPFIDCVILMRATMSAGLYIQMIGRGFRICEGKKNFLVLDFGQNVQRHGCIDDIGTQPFKKTKKGCAPIKLCPICQCATYINTKECRNCGYKYKFNDNEKLDAFSSDLDVLSFEAKPLVKKVHSMLCYIHKKPGKPDSIKVIYNVGNFGFEQYAEYICLYHEGYANMCAQEWWYDRCTDPIPDDIDQALEMIRNFKIPFSIEIKRNGKYWNIIGYSFIKDCSTNTYSTDDILI